MLAILSHSVNHQMFSHIRFCDTAAVQHSELEGVLFGFELQLFKKEVVRLIIRHCRG